MRVTCHVFSLTFTVRGVSNKHCLLTFFIFQGVGGSNYFKGGGGVQMLISIETHITCAFPGGGVGTPYPPSGSANVK